MLYVAGEIFVWMALAFALGVLVGWFVWGIKRGRAVKAPTAASTTAVKPTGDVSIRPAVRPVAEDTAPPLPPTPPAGTPAIPRVEPAAAEPAPEVSQADLADLTAPAIAGAAAAGAAGVAAGALDAPAAAEVPVDDPTTAPVPVTDAPPPGGPDDQAAGAAASAGLAALVADEGPHWATEPPPGDPLPTPAGGQPLSDLDEHVGALEDEVAAAHDRSEAEVAAARLATAEEAAAAQNVASARAATPDLDAGAAALGRPVDTDDLKVVEGIGPRIEEVLKESGIGTWPELADASPDRLRTILDLAGDQFRVHDPTTWPRQAGLAAAGRWDELVALQASLAGGRRG